MRARLEALVPPRSKAVISHLFLGPSAILAQSPYVFSDSPYKFPGTFINRGATFHYLSIWGRLP